MRSGMRRKSGPMSKDHSIFRAYLRDWRIGNDDKLYETDLETRRQSSVSMWVHDEKRNDNLWEKDGDVIGCRMMTAKLESLRDEIENRRWYTVRTSIHRECADNTISRSALDAVLKAFLLMLFYHRDGRQFIRSKVLAVPFAPIVRERITRRVASRVFGIFVSDSTALTPLNVLEMEAQEWAKNRVEEKIDTAGHLTDDRIKEVFISSFEEILNAVRSSTLIFHRSDGRRFFTAKRPVVIDDRKRAYFPVTKTVCLEASFHDQRGQSANFERAEAAVVDRINYLLASNNRTIYSCFEDAAEAMRLCR